MNEMGAIELDSSGSGCGPVTESWQHGNGTSGSTKRGNIFITGRRTAF